MCHTALLPLSFEFGGHPGRLFRVLSYDLPFTLRLISHFLFLPRQGLALPFYPYFLRHLSAVELGFTPPHYNESSPP